MADCPIGRVLRENESLYLTIRGLANRSSRNLDLAIRDLADRNRRVVSLLVD